ncbi:MAG: glycosyltransferase family 2 protein [Lachnospiraceae bacterium]|nr:glycosyltransferase family 2 protein [Lachnospiraceae bacterium]MDD3615903.1 glycosyltransferase family 2 protein [Lachnospiraceae bacterium]
MEIQLSIITPCYNGEEFIGTAIESFIRQKNPAVELIVVDDGSTDATGSICQKYADANIHYIRTENKGAGHARNVGMKEAKGRWIAYLDADDLLLSGSMDEDFMEKMSTYGSKDVDILCTPKLRTDMELKTPVEITRPDDVQPIKNHIPAMEFWACIYDKDFLLDNQIFFYEYKQQDIETAFRYLTFSMAKKIEINDDMKFYLQRNNLSSNTHTWNHYNLYRIKALVYFDLYMRTVCEEDKHFLWSTALEYVFEYYKLSFEHGIYSEDGLKEMHQLWKKVKKESSNVKCSLEDEESMKRIGQLDIRRIFWKGKKAKSPEVTSEKNPEVVQSEILERLEKVSKELLGK